MTKHIYKTECVVCEAPVDDYEPEMCCNGHMCGCMGMPVEPPLCSLECTEKLFGKPVDPTDKDLAEWDEFFGTLSDEDAEKLFGEEEHGQS